MAASKRLNRLNVKPAMGVVQEKIPTAISQTFTKLEYLLQETGLGLRRGGWMNWAAISTVTVLLFLLGMGLQVSWQVDGLLRQVGSQLEISVYLRPEVAANNLSPLIQQFPQVSSIKVIPKDQAWTELLKELGSADIEGATQGLEGNPLVDELKVSVRHPSEVPQLAQQIAQLQGVDGVQYLDQALRHLAQLTQGLNQVGIAMVTLLTLTAIAVISTTIRLIVMARRQEIEVMQLVGATATWIYMPFLLQGIGFGLLGAGIAWSLITVIQQFVKRLLDEQSDLLKLLASSLQLSTTQLIVLPLILLGFGGLVGLAGSLLAVRRFTLR
jgi:cell division transport system permease protein